MSPLRPRSMISILLFMIAAIPVVASSVQEEAPTNALPQAGRLIDEGRVQDAIALLEQALDADQESTETVIAYRAVLGGLYLEIGKPDEAWSLLEPMTAESADPAILYNAARAALAIGRKAEGETLLERSVASFPNSPAARALGMIRARQGRTIEAYRLLRMWASTNPQDVSARTAAAWLALRLRRPSVAEQLLSDLPQDTPPMRLLWARLLLQQDQPEAALAILSALEDELADDATAPRLLEDLGRLKAEALVKQGNPAAARKSLGETTPTNMEDALLHARVHLGIEDFDAALLILTPHIEVLAKGPGEVKIENLEATRELYLLHGRALLPSDPARAAVSLRKATEMEPWNVGSMELLQQALEQAGMQDDAAIVGARAEEIRRTGQSGLFNLRPDPSDPTGSVLLTAQRWLLNGNAERALAIARREALVAEDLRPRFLEVQALLKLGRVEEASRVADLVLAAAPENADAVYQKGLVLMVGGDGPGAEAMMRRALEVSADHTAAMNDLALLLLSRNEKEESKQLLERVLLLRPRDERALELLSEIDG